MDTKPTIEVLSYYATPGMMTDPGPYRPQYADLPTDIGELCQVIQNNLIHIFWAERYGRKLKEGEDETVNIRPVAQKLALMGKENPIPLTAARTLSQRQVGNCRDFSLLLTSILRARGVPARARCGFGAYFLPNHFEDHWVSEVWHQDQKRWVLVDAQLDALQCKELGVSFDPTDVPRDQFIVAGQAWQMCRLEKAAPQQFGIFEMRGWWFIWGNVVREILSLNKIELLPWDILPGCMTHNLEAPLVDGPELAFYDGIAALTLAADVAWADLRAIYDKDARFHLTEDIQI